MYTVEYFISKYKAIPEDKWCVGALTKGTQACANGHCGISSYGEKTEESESLFILFSELTLTDSGVGTWLETKEDSSIYGFYSDAAANVNDGYTKEYQQPTAKQRILAALYDIKKQQQPVYEDITHELAVLPIEETADHPIKQLS